MFGVFCPADVINLLNIFLIPHIGLGGLWLSSCYNLREILGEIETTDIGVKMLRAAIAFFVLALIAMLFGATGFAGVSMDIGRTLLFIFLVLAVISFVVSLFTGRPSKPI